MYSTFQVISAIISLLSTEVTRLLGIVCQVATSLLTVNYVVVESCLHLICAIYDLIANNLHELHRALCYSLEDFLVFLRDIRDICAFVVNTASEGVSQLVNAISDTYVTLVSGVSTSFNSTLECIGCFLNATEYLVLAIVSFINLVGRAIALIGQTFVLILCLLTKSVVASICCIWFAIVATVWFVENVFLWCHKTTVDTVILVANSTVALVVGIPLDCYLGVVLGYLVFLTCKYLWKSQRIRHISARFLNTLSAVRHNFHLETWRVRRVPDNNNDAASSSESYVSDTDDDDDVSVPLRIANSPAKLGRNRSDDVLHLKRQLEEERDRRLCIICQDRERCIALLPCRHLCLCEDCSDRVLNHGTVCPVCRVNIYDVIQVYS